MDGAAPEVVLATRNLKKRAELEALLRPHGISVRTLDDFPPIPEVVEDGATFAENAAKKACETAQSLNCWVIGEDSGLEVAALNGAPGVYSARYSGEGATDERNNARLMQELADVPDDRRDARYVCHAAVADPTGQVRLYVEEYCSGRIAREARGTGGFGYDPYFIVREYHRTFGELSPLAKQQLSHRGRALRRLVPQLRQLLAGNAP